MALIIMGRAASGKSALARSVGRELGWEVFSSDFIRKELAGVPLYKRSGPAVRRHLYSNAMTRKTYRTLFQNAINRLKERRSLIIEATFSSREHRDELGQKLSTLGEAYYIIETQASEQTLRRRLIEREGKTKKVSDARLEDFEMLTRSYELPVEIGKRHLIAVHTERPLEATVLETLKALAQRTLRGAKNKEAKCPI
jgi:predicted kinase